MKKYLIYWIDKYVNGYRKGCTHASIDGAKSICGIDFSKTQIDGGYQDTTELMPECKKCIKLMK